jgi:hypothetical protein
MKHYGIFDENNGLKLLRYSNAPQTGREYQKFDYSTKTFYTVKEICLPNIEYSSDNIGKFYDPNTEIFLN